jgi:hypothetical protein
MNEKIMKTKKEKGIYISAQGHFKKEHYSKDI